MTDRTNPLIFSGTEKLCQQTHGRYDYLVQRKECGTIGVPAAFSPECPKTPPKSSNPWELVCVTAVGNVVFHYWRRYR